MLPWAPRLVRCLRRDELRSAPSQRVASPQKRKPGGPSTAAAKRRRLGDDVMAEMSAKQQIYVSELLMHIAVGDHVQANGGGDPQPGGVPDLSTAAEAGDISQLPAPTLAHADYAAPSYIVADTQMPVPDNQPAANDAAMELEDKAAKRLPARDRWSQASIWSRPVLVRMSKSCQLCFLHLASRRDYCCSSHHCVMQVARGLARRVRGSHVAEMAATLGVDFRTVAREVADGGIEDLETLQVQLQEACKDAIDAYMAQQGDEGELAQAASPRGDCWA